MLKVYGSPLCPDCTACKAAFDANGIEYDFVDITGSMRNLKEFLRHRDADDAFADARKNGYVGIPALLREDGSLSTDWEAYLKEKGASADAATCPVGCGLHPIEFGTGASPSGQSCRIDGSGC